MRFADVRFDDPSIFAVDRAPPSAKERRRAKRAYSRAVMRCLPREEAFKRAVSKLCQPNVIERMVYTSNPMMMALLAKPTDCINRRRRTHRPLRWQERRAKLGTFGGA